MPRLLIESPTVLRESHDEPTFGFTLLELLAVIAVVGVLISLLLPSLQAAREASRRVKCKNNLKQQGLALLDRHDAHGSFPFGGWGRDWVGMPDQGNGRHQPGGWIYSVLPSIEASALYDLGIQGTEEEKHVAYTQRLETALPLFTCPSRRPAALYPVSESYRSKFQPFGSPTNLGRSDYAINSGASHIVVFPGPPTFEHGIDPNFWQSQGTAVTDVSDFTGISHLRIGARLAQVTDGASNTYLAGEKHIWFENYENGKSVGDDGSMYGGYSFDLHRFTATSSFAGEVQYLPPIPDNVRITQLQNFPTYVRFGSAHPGGCNMVRCDGSVMWINWEIDPELHRRLGHRFDGL